jgi:hypothetical protein
MHGTETALIEVLADIFAATDRQHATFFGLVDFNAAFHRDILGHGTELRRIKTFLCD